jgi:hypothetical protein
MASWTLPCPNCHSSFVHSIIEVKEIADYFLPEKPYFTADGAQFRCSNCGTSALIYAIGLDFHFSQGEADQLFL